MKISYIFPSRSRPKKFFEGLANINDMSDSDDYEIICALDQDDETMNSGEIIEEAEDYNNVKIFYGLSGGKISACNREVSKISHDTSIICLFSDDMKFLKFGFDNDIRDAFSKFFPSLDGVVHFPDSHALARTMTMTMMGVNLYKQLGYLYHPDFFSVYADNHITEMAKAMNKYVFVNKKILDHFHPGWNMAEWDDQYRRTEAPENYKRDRDTFNKLKANNFGL